MTTVEYLDVKDKVIAAGYADEIDWAQGLKPVTDPFVFFCEYGWVICNSGMKFQVAKVIWVRVKAALHNGEHVRTAFKHPGKSAAIQLVWEQQKEKLAEYLAAPDKLAYCESLPWIGPITKYHLAKNLGVDVCKPDRHLERIALHYGTSCGVLCGTLAAATGDRVATVDMVLWRASNLKIIETRQLGDKQM